MRVLLAETAPVRSILLAWPYAQSDWCDSLAAAEICYWQMLKAFLSADQNIELWVLLHPSVDLAVWQACAKQNDLPPGRITVIHTIEYNDTWIRDYGPLSLTDGYCSYCFNGWGQKYGAKADNAVSEQLASLLGARVEKIAFVAEGGALEINSDGVLLANTNCVIDELRNPGLGREAVEAEFEKNLGIKEFIWLDDINLTGDDTDGHIDTIARFSECEGIVACGLSPEHHDANELEKLNQQLVKICKQRNWSLYELPMPVIRSKIDERLLPATYANFLLVNGVVFAPIYDAPEDEAALAVLQQAYPNYKIVPVMCDALLEQHGSLHCATMQISQITGD